MDGSNGKPGARAGSNRLSLLTPAEREQVLYGFNQTAMAYRRESLFHERVESQVERTPNAIAVICDDEQLTYAQLNSRANRLARVLRARGVQPDDRVALYVERSAQMIVALLGILKAGGAYVPLDPSYPVERLGYLLTDSQPRLVLTQLSLQGSLPASGVEVLVLDGERHEIEREADGNLDALAVGLHSGHLAYVIYTSGSTGAPKGVMVEHHNLVNLVTWHCAAFGVGEGCRSSCVAALGFDAATWEIWPSLSVGGTLHLASSAVARDTEKLIRWWTSQPLDVSFLPTPVAELIFSQGLSNPALRTLLIGGDRLRNRPAGLSFALINNYGPTEATVVATSGPIQENDAALHIGRPIGNTQIYILDAHRRPVPVGVAGEIHIGGAGVARGYLNRPELTRERFVTNPFSTHTAAMMYRTGDLGRWRPDGTIEFMGRNDQQVKIRGYRIEPGEVETQLAAHAQVKDAVVLAREDAAGQLQLVAYVVTEASQELSPPLREFLQQRLPPYMVPAAIVRLDELPLTPNGKVDRRALAAPQEWQETGRAYVAPRTPTEETLSQIWQTVLGLERVGIQDNFFEIGGHSLLGVKLIWALTERFGVHFTAAEIFRYPNIERMAAALDSAKPARRPSAQSRPVEFEEGAV